MLLQSCDVLQFSKYVVVIIETFYITINFIATLKHLGLRKAGNKNFEDNQMAGEVETFVKIFCKLSENRKYLISARDKIQMSKI